jgi:isoprenylcysteine carboxyl methyltransferase (ICMT) family protein YpbQ
MTPAPPRDTSAPISERFARTALVFERYVLPWFSFVLAWTQISPLLARYARHQIVIRAGFHEPSWALFWAGMTRNVLLSCLSIFIGLTMLVSRRPVHLPKTIAHLAVPLAMSYYFFLYRAVDFLPYGLRRNLLPVEWQVPAAALAVFLALTGYAVALWGILSLRRSFATFVAVRVVVSRGPYAYFRHPMYLGYLFELSGLLLSSFSPAMLVLAVGFVALVVMRAQLEEDRLVEACPAYRDYMNRTGFLFPRFGRHVEPAAPSGPPAI